MSVEKKIRKLEKRDGPVCGICKLDISKELEKLHSLFRWRRSTHEERAFFGLRKVRRKNINLNIDHILPESRGGSNYLSNLALTHRTCNDWKADLLLEELEGSVVIV
jgi:5-methylcytosine-specific restriction endonuclease McrA